MESWAITLLLSFGIIPVLIYLFLISNYDHWKKRCVATAKVKPLVGSYGSFLTQKQHMCEDVDEIYRAYKPSEQYVGMFQMRIPQLLLLDIELIHDILVKSFKHFPDNDFSRILDGQKDPLMASNPFFTKGETWKKNRAMVTPGFTSSRLKLLYPQMLKISSNLSEYLSKEFKINAGKEIDTKDLAMRFTADMVGECVLGINANSFSAQPVPLVENTKNLFADNMTFMLIMMLSGLFPQLHTVFRAKTMPKQYEDFFVQLFQKSFQLRRDNKVESADFLNYLLDMQQRKGFSDLEMCSHAMTFLLDGLETSSSVIAQTLMFLAAQPEAQQRLRAEILQQQQLNSSTELSYESLTELDYLDACIHEALRLLPPLTAGLKTCTEAYEFINKKGQVFKFLPGDCVVVPVYSIHMDPEYYEQPQEFRPERFLATNADGGLKKYRNEGSYLGFGDGPRMCVGMRFGLLQSKLAIATILSQYQLKLNEKTPKQFKLDPKQFTLFPIGGIWLDFEKL